MSLFYEPNSLIGTQKNIYTRFLIIFKGTVFEFDYYPLFGTPTFPNIEEIIFVIAILVLGVSEWGYRTTPHT